MSGYPSLEIRAWLYRMGWAAVRKVSARFEAELTEAELALCRYSDRRKVQFRDQAIQDLERLGADLTASSEHVEFRLDVLNRTAIAYSWRAHDLSSEEDGIPAIRLWEQLCRQLQKNHPSAGSTLATLVLTVPSDKPLPFAAATSAS